MRQKYITEWRPVGEEFPSQYGYVTYLKWCEHEVVRMGRGTVEFQKQERECCLSVGG